MENNISFSCSADNIEYSANLSYLLNFWHTTKVNKENEFIKRNGIHPLVVPTERRGYIDFNTSEGNSIQTNFYTVFRIFIENYFNKEVKTLKERNAEQWIVNFKPETNGLNSKSFLLLYYAKKKSLNSDIVEMRNENYRRTTAKPSLKFNVKLRNKDQLHSKKILDCFDDYEANAKENIDQEISLECNRLMPFIKKHLNFNKSQNENLKPKLKSVDFSVSPEIRELLPFYTQLNSSISGMDSRIKFSFILNYAKQMGNLAANQIENSEENYQQFNTLTNSVGVL